MRVAVMGLLGVFLLLTPSAAVASPTPQSQPSPLILTPADLGPGFDFIAQATTSFGATEGVTAHFALFRRPPDAAGGGPYLVETAYITGATQDIAGIDPLRDGLMTGVTGGGQFFTTRRVQGPSVGDGTAWFTGRGTAADAVHEIHGVLARVGQAYVAVVILGFEGQVEQSMAGDYARVAVDRVR